MILRNEDVQKITDQWARETEKEERKLIRKQAIGKYYRKGWVAGIVWATGFMVRKGRKDIAQAIMKEAYLDREQCREAGLAGQNRAVAHPEPLLYEVPIAYYLKFN